MAKLGPALFSITEDDLAELEHIMPELHLATMETMGNKTRTQLRKVQTILSNVRWGYGPAEDVETTPFDGGENG